MNAVLSSNNTTVEFKVYKWRWVILIIYAINCFANSLLFGCITAINNIAYKYWNVPPEIIDWLPEGFAIIYVLIALPAAYFMSSFGLRVCLLFGSSLNAISTALHFAGYQRDGFPYVMAGQVAAALAAAPLLQIPTRLSTVWFPESEHAKATGVGIIFPILGAGVGFLQPTQMIPNSEKLAEVEAGMYKMFLSQMVFLGLWLIIGYLFFHEHPPTPPSYAAAFTKKGDQEFTFYESLSSLASNWHYNMLVHVFGIYFGVYIFSVSSLNEMVCRKVDDVIIGWMGFVNNTTAMIGIIVSTQVIDRYKCYRLLSVIVMFGVLASWIAFTYFVMYGDSRLAIFISFSIVGLFGTCYFAIGLEHAAELTYPILESTSSAVVLLVANLYSFIFVYVLGRWVDEGRISLVCYITIGLYAFVFVLTCFNKAEMKRHEVEAKHQMDLENQRDMLA